MHYWFKILKFYLLIHCPTCFGHHCAHHQELPTSAYAVSGHRVVLVPMFSPALFRSLWCFSVCSWRGVVLVPMFPPVLEPNKTGGNIGTNTTPHHTTPHHTTPHHTTPRHEHTLKHHKERNKVGENIGTNTTRWPDNACVAVGSSWWWAQWCPKHVEQCISI
jgi:hypothetical protein